MTWRCFSNAYASKRERYLGFYALSKELWKRARRSLRLNRPPPPLRENEAVFQTLKAAPARSRSLSTDFSAGSSSRNSLHIHWYACRMKEGARARPSFRRRR